MCHNLHIKEKEQKLNWIGVLINIRFTLKKTKNLTNASFNPFIIAFDTSLDFIIWMHQVQSYLVSIQVFANCIIRQNAFLSISANALQLLSRSPACKKRPPFSLSLCTPCADLVSLSTTQLPIAIPAVDRQLVSTFPLNSIPTPTPLLTSKDLKKRPLLFIINTVSIIFSNIMDSLHRQPFLLLLLGFASLLPSLGGQPINISYVSQQGISSDQGPL